jgi:hypothetical protein
MFELPTQELTAFWAQVATVRSVLARMYGAEAFNIGVALSREGLTNVVGQGDPFQ